MAGHDQRLPVRLLVEMPADPEAGWSAAVNPLPVEEMRALLDRGWDPGFRAAAPAPVQPMVTTRAQDGGASGT